MVDFKKDTWIYGLLSAIFAIIGILVPWEYDDPVSTWGAGIINDDGDWLGTGATLWTLGLTFMSIAALLIISISTWKGKDWKWDWLFYVLTGIIMLIFPILALVYEATEGAMPIGPIFIIIAGVIGIAAFVLDKFIGGE
jgi:hypothetical protein